jgi:hypothetical protein
MSCLAPCPACDRHVATDETVCPFCSAALPDSFRLQARCERPGGRLNRAALLAAAGAALIGAEACGSGVALYGAPLPDAGLEAGPNDGSAVPIYGAAPAPLEQAPPGNGAAPPAGNKKT